MKKEITITIPDDLSGKDELIAIQRQLTQKALSGHGRQKDRVRIGDLIEVKDLTTTIVIHRKSKEKPIELVKCGCCNTEYQSDVFFSVFVNYGGRTKHLKYCSESCQEAVIQFCGSGRASKKKSKLPHFMKFSSSILLIALYSCKPTPEFYKDGKAYYTETNCVKSHVEMKWGYGFAGWGKPAYRYCFHPETVCDQYVIDTLEIK